MAYGAASTQGYIGASSGQQVDAPPPRPTLLMSIDLASTIATRLEETHKRLVALGDQLHGAPPPQPVPGVDKGVAIAGALDAIGERQRRSLDLLNLIDGEISRIANGLG